MTFVTKTILPNGSIRIKIGRRVTVLKTSDEAQAFIAGYKIAQMQIARKIAGLLKVTDKTYDI